jgi:hypothetical protein
VLTGIGTADAETAIQLDCTAKSAAGDLIVGV